MYYSQTWCAQVISINLCELSGSKSFQWIYMDLVGPSQFNQFIWTSWVQVSFEELKSHYRYHTHYETSYSCDLPGLQAARPRRTPTRYRNGLECKKPMKQRCIIPRLGAPKSFQSICHFNQFIWTWWVQVNSINLYGLRGSTSPSRN